MKRKTVFKKIALALLLVFIGIQLIRPQKNKGAADTPDDITHFVTVPDTVMRILKVSCYDCHSNSTNYPWYAEVAPSSWWLAKHIRDGKAELNFSEFAQYSKRRMKSKLNSIGEQVEKREMPLKSYLLIHRGAELSKSQIQLIKAWTDSAQAELNRVM